MGFLDDAQGVFDRGVTAARGAVSTVAGEQLGFVRGFARMCSDGWMLGYHERNGGNASYRLTAADVSAIRPFFYTSPSSWVPLSVEEPDMGGEYLLVTGSGKYLRNVALDTPANCGIVELDAAGSAWRIVWGLKNDARPTSEISAHVAAHAARKLASGGTERVLYHAHPNALIALTTYAPSDPRTLTRILWGAHTESVIACPGGVGAVGCMVPGSKELAHETAAMLKTYKACVWALHGVFASGIDFDDAFGLVQALDKAADVYIRGRQLSGAAELPVRLSDADIRAIAMAYRLPLNEAFLG